MPCTRIAKIFRLQNPGTGHRNQGKSRVQDSPWGPVLYPTFSGISLSCTPFLHFEVPEAFHKNFKDFRSTKMRYRTYKSWKMQGTGQPLGTCPVPHFSSVFYVLYLGFAFENPLWHRVGQEKQGTGQITKVGYRTRVLHQEWTTRLPRSQMVIELPCMEINRPRWALQL